MCKRIALTCGIIAALFVVPVSANAAISSVFNDTVGAFSPISCTLQDGTGGTSNTGYRFCGTTANTRIPSWDGTPIDVSVSFPPATGSDDNYPLVGIYHGWGGSKTPPSASGTTRWLAQGYAVISVTDRGWGASCGGPANAGNSTAGLKPAPCSDGYIHLMDNAYEVRDAQYLMGLLADDGYINPTQIAATGGSYGGAISEQLAVLKNRTALNDGTLIPWQSPDGTDLSIAAALPDYTWSDLPSALMPNGANLDYVTDSPYRGPNDDKAVGVNKSNWVGMLNLGGTLAGYYAPTTGVGFPDAGADMTGWFAAIGTGGPYGATADGIVDELSANHSAYGIDDSTAPAPMLIGNGWNDDLFPVSEGVRMYNKIRANHSSTPVKLYELDYGHTPRSANFPADLAGLGAAQNAWVNYYVKGAGSAPTDALGGVTITTSKCSGTSRIAGDTYTAPSWAALSQGEVRVSGSAAQTIGTSTSPSSTFVSTSGTVCDNAASTSNTPGAAVYTSDPAPAGGYTIAGSPTVHATLSSAGSNNQLTSRLYDVDPTGGTTTLKLIARGIYRPQAGTSSQLFQLFPQAYMIAPGHQLKLELLSADTPYTQASSASAPQQPVTVSDMTLAVPVRESPGALGGFVKGTSTKTLPNGYTVTDDVLDNDSIDPSATDDVNADWHTSSVLASLSASDEGGSGVDTIYYEDGSSPPNPTTSSPQYNPNNKPSLGNGQLVKYFAVDNAGNAGAVQTSAAAHVDPNTPDTSVVAPPSPSSNASPSIAFSATTAGATFECSLDGSGFAACASPYVPSSPLAIGDHVFKVRGKIASGAFDPTPAEAYFTVSMAIPGAPVPAKLALKAKLKGKAKVGKKVSFTTTGTSDGKRVNGLKLSYVWKAGSKTVGKKSSLKLTKKMLGKKVTVKITATRSGYATASKTVVVAKKLKK